MIRTLIVLAVLAPQAGAAEQSVEIYTMLHGDMRHCELPRSAALVEDAIGALQTSTYEAPTRKASQYSRLAQTIDHARIVFLNPESVRMKFSTRGPATWHTVSIDELLIVNPGDSGPDYVLVRSGSRLRAFSKFSPAAISGVVRAITAGAICQ